MQHTRLVNGVRVTMTAAEIKAFEDEQATAAIERAERTARRDLVRKRQAALRVLEERLLEREGTTSDAPQEITDYLAAATAQPAPGGAE